MRISDQYREANRRLHEINPKYGASSAKWAPKVSELARSIRSRSILDYGCGKGLLAAALPELEIREYDPAIAGKDAEPKPADLVICTDVLEHIEPAYLDDVLSHLRGVTLKRAFLNIATRPAVKTLPDGRNAHLIIESETWWRARIERFFHIIEWSPDGDWAVNSVVRPRRRPDPKGRTDEKGWFAIPGIQSGRWTMDRQMAGLDVLRRACPGASILDLGCAEGLISLELAKAGAALVHGVELEGSRLQVAEQLFQKDCAHVSRQFIQWDLTRFDELYLGHTPDSPPETRFLQSRYDIVLCLAIAQKLPNPGRFLRLASTLCSDVMAVRLPYPIIDDPRSSNIAVDVRRMLHNEFELIQETAGYPEDVSRPYQPGDQAWLGIFRRNNKWRRPASRMFRWFRS